MNAYVFSIDRWPLVVVTLGGDMSDDDHDALFRDWEAVFAREQRFAGITDTRNVRTVGSAKQRARVAAWTRSVESRVAAYSVGHAVVVESTLVRGALTAIGWLHKTPAPERYVSTMLDAYDFCLERLGRARVQVPPHLVAHRAALAATGS